MNPPWPKIDPSGLADRPARTIMPNRLSAMPKACWSDRLIAAAVAVLAGGVLAVAASLVPDARGHGTHQQLGLPACSSEAITGRPCPTCGMTTAFAYFVRGDLAGALRAQVLGTVLAAMTLLATLGGMASAVTGAPFGPVLRRVFVERIDWLYLLIVLGLASWALKIYIG